MAKVTKSKLLQLQRTLVTDERIGRKLGVTRQAIHQLRKRLGIVSRRVKNPERNARIVAMYEAGASGRQLAERFGISVSQTFRVIAQARRTRKRKK